MLAPSPMRILTTAPLIALTLVAAAPGPAEREIRYGSDSLQTADFVPPVHARGPSPLVIFVHGGGWKRGDKSNATGRSIAPHFTGRGYAFASINYRLVPAATVEQQAQDVADAVSAFIARADKLGIDRRRIVIMGHSAGAHLVALVGTDPRYLRKAGLDTGALAGVIAVDGAAYDVTPQMAQAGPWMRKTYTQAFGSDPKRQNALSPVHHAAAPNAPAFLLLHVMRVDGVEQARNLESALNRAGTPVRRTAFEGRGLAGHMEINRRLGAPDYPATGVVDEWLAQTFS